MPISWAVCQNRDEESRAASRPGWSASSISTTIRRARLARADPADTTMPSAGSRMHDAASTRSPSISTMHARQFPSGRYPGCAEWHKCGISMPLREATSQMVSPFAADTGLPSSWKVMFPAMRSPPLRINFGRRQADSLGTPNNPFGLACHHALHLKLQFGYWSSGQRPF